MQEYLDKKIKYIKADSKGVIWSRNFIYDYDAKDTFVSYMRRDGVYMNVLRRGYVLIGYDDGKNKEHGFVGVCEKFDRMRVMDLIDLIDERVKVDSFLEDSFDILEFVRRIYGRD